MVQLVMITKHKKNYCMNSEQRRFSFFISPSFTNKLRVGILLALIVLIITSIVSYNTFNTAIEESRMVTHSYEVKVEIEKAISYMKDAETGLRGFLLTRDSSFLEPYNNAKKLIDPTYQKLSLITTDNPNQQKRVVALKIIGEERIKYLDSLKNYYTIFLNDTIITKRLFLNGKRLMDNAREIVKHMEMEENHLLNSRFGDTQNYINQAKVIIIIFMLVAVLIISVSFFLLLKSIKELQEKEKTYRNVFEYSSDMICLCTKDLSIIEANPLFIKVFGLEPLANKQVNMNTFFIDTGESNRINHLIAINKNIMRSKISFKGLKGEEHICLANFNLMDATTKTYSVVLTDITQQELMQKENLALERFSNIGKVSRLLAHEVRNPLTNINLAVEGISADNSNEDLLPYIDIIVRNSKRINSIVTELLNSTKPNVPEYADVDIEELFAAVLLLAKDRIEFQHVTVNEKFASPLPTIKGDSEKLTIALLNIIINAIEALPKENGVIHIEVFATNEDLLQINITDNGIGMNEETIQHIFQPFYTKKVNGTGLGLAGAQNIILMHKGNISVNSNLNSGTKFIIQLPFE